MHAWMIDAPGDEAALAMRELAAPEPGPGQVAIAVSACGVNFADLLMLNGSYQATPPLPFAPGGEVCGAVVAVGEDVPRDWIDARVAAYCGHGGFAEFACAPVGACVRVPDTLSDAICAALPVAHGSAEIALARRARLAEGDWLLVGGAGGGVGLTGVEIGALLGARVIGVARGTEKCTVARQFGAEATIDSDGLDLQGTALKQAVMEITGGHGADVVFDPVGGDLGRSMNRAAAFEARLLPIGFASGDVPEFKANHLLVKNVDVIGFWWGAYLDRAPQVFGESMRRLFAWAEQGRIAPRIALEVPFSRAPEALAALRGRKIAGKVVVTADP